MDGGKGNSLPTQHWLIDFKNIGIQGKNGFLL